MKFVRYPLANLVKKDIPDSEDQVKRKRIRKHSNEPLTRIHARVYHLFRKMLAKLGHMFLHQKIKLK